MSVDIDMVDWRDLEQLQEKRKFLLNKQVDEKCEDTLDFAL